MQGQRDSTVMWIRVGLSRRRLCINNSDNQKRTRNNKTQGGVLLDRQGQ